MTVTAQGVFYFDPADPIYVDHFPGHPVVPGSLIVWAFTQAMEKTGHATDRIGIEPFRFKRFISPGSYPYRIEETESGLKCSLFHNDQTVAQGTIRT